MCRGRGCVSRRVERSDKHLPERSVVLNDEDVCGRRFLGQHATGPDGGFPATTVIVSFAVAGGLNA